MKTELEKQIEIDIEICEKFIHLKHCIGYSCNGRCEDYDNAINEDACPHNCSGFSCHSETENGADIVELSKAFLKKHKPEETMITKEELIEKCEIIERSEKVLNKLHELGFKWNSGKSLINDEVGVTSKSLQLYEEKYVLYTNEPGVSEKTFLSYFTPSVTIDKNVTAIDNPSVETKLLNKREKFEARFKDVAKQMDEALTLIDDDGAILCKYEDDTYKPAKQLSPERMLKVANWAIDLEKDGE